MPNFITLLLKRSSRLIMNPWLILFLITFGLVGLGKPVDAKTPGSAPPQLKTILTQIDTAASMGDVKGVMQFYSPTFTHGDGLNRQTMEQALSKFWKQYPRLRYSTQLKSWKSEGNSIIAETVTKITGLPSSNRDRLALNATIFSRQRLTGNKITRQEILSERTEITSGIKPPQVDINLPKQVKVGQSYNFDAIVQEPLGEDYLLGKAMEEPIQAANYLTPSKVELELLKAGGLFKIGRAPSTPGNQWISAVVMRGNGMTMITQRLRVVK